jgi:hypothetical protein
MLPDPASVDAQTPRWDRWMIPLYWLAGVRWSALRAHPPTERERMALLGATVLIPAVLGFPEVKHMSDNPSWGLNDLSVVFIATGPLVTTRELDRLVQPLAHWRIDAVPTLLIDVGASTSEVTAPNADAVTRAASGVSRNRSTMP